MGGRLMVSRSFKSCCHCVCRAGPDLNRILGYIPPGDVPAESESDGDADGLGEAGAGADSVVDREYIKMRAAKITARHNAKAAAAAAAQSQQSR
jgi:hypothetical protein